MAPTVERHTLGNFKRLPAEIRNQIYHLTFANMRPIYYRFGRHYRREPSSTGFPPLCHEYLDKDGMYITTQRQEEETREQISTYTALSAASPDLHRECSAVYFDKAVFYFMETGRGLLSEWKVRGIGALTAMDRDPSWC